MAFLDTHVGQRLQNADGWVLRWGVESICAQLTEMGAKIAPATYYEHRARTLSKQQLRDEALNSTIAARHAGTTASRAHGRSG